LGFDRSRASVETKLKSRRRNVPTSVAFIETMYG
jgi:hypothetical protein